MQNNNKTRDAHKRRLVAERKLAVKAANLSVGICPHVFLLRCLSHGPPSLLVAAVMSVAPDPHSAAQPREPLPAPTIIAHPCRATAAGIILVEDKPLRSLASC